MGLRNTTCSNASEYKAFLELRLLANLRGSIWEPTGRSVESAPPSHQCHHPCVPIRPGCLSCFTHTTPRDHHRHTRSVCLPTAVPSLALRRSLECRMAPCDHHGHTLCLPSIVPSLYLTPSLAFRCIAVNSTQLLVSLEKKNIA
jgi:hypothetical protein